MKRRLLLMAVLFGLLFLGLTARLVAIQVVDQPQWAEYAKRIQEDEFVEPGVRGRIYDRNGVLLAQDLPAVSIALDNYHMSQPEVLIALLQEHLGLARAELEPRVYKEGYFTWIARQVDLGAAERLKAAAREAGVDGLLFTHEPRRTYPEGKLASNVVGFTGLDHHGLEGVELAYDGLLGGKDTRVHVRRTAHGTELEREVTEDGGPGLDLTLTLDARVQRIAEQKLDWGLREFRAKDGFVVVLDPRTGELLAMAQAQRYDLNRYGASSAGQRLNQAVARAYEPGSLFKVFTALAALEAGAVGLSERFDGDTPVRIAGHSFGNAESHIKFGSVTLKGIIQNSINLGMIRVAQRLGERGLHGYLTKLDFAEKTGLGLPGELPGSLIPLERWSTLEIGAVSIGQAVSVTGIQLASRMAAIANGGRLMQPYVLKETRRPDGALVRQYHPRLDKTIASPLNAERLTRMMEAVVEAGTGTQAQLEGFSVAAKSGTAQKAVPGRGYLEDKFISSFAGFFPADDPEFMILVVLDEVGTTPVWGGRTAGSVFQRIAERLIDLSNLHP